VRVLIVAPSQPGLNTIPEVRLIQSWHHTSTLNGEVTAQDVYQCARETAFDIIHFAAPCGPEGVLLSNDALLTAEDIAQVARLKSTPELYFHYWQSGRLASYAVRHGVRTAICAEAVLETQAWKLPLAYYSARRNGHAGDPIGAYIMADSGDGDYSLHIAPDYVRDLQRVAAAAPVAQPAVSRVEMLRWLAFAVLAAVVLSWAILRLGGG